MGTKCSTFVIILFCQHRRRHTFMCYRLKNFYFPSPPKSMSGGYFNSSFFSKETTFAAVVWQNCCLFSLLFSKLLHKQSAFMGVIIFNVLGWTLKRIFAGQHFISIVFLTTTSCLKIFFLAKQKYPLTFYY